MSLLALTGMSISWSHLPVMPGVLLFLARRPQLPPFLDIRSFQSTSFRFWIPCLSFPFSLFPVSALGALITPLFCLPLNFLLVDPMSRARHRKLAGFFKSPFPDVQEFFFLLPAITTYRLPLHCQTSGDISRTQGYIYLFGYNACSSHSILGERVLVGSPLPYLGSYIPLEEKRP